MEERDNWVRVGVAAKERWPRITSNTILIELSPRNESQALITDPRPRHIGYLMETPVENSRKTQQMVLMEHWTVPEPDGFQFAMGYCRLFDTLVYWEEK